MKSLSELFHNNHWITKIQKKLPYLFQLAELECSRANKIGMEVGSMREKILVALFIYAFGEQNVETEIPITEAEVDVIVFKNPISIKTITGKTPSGVKLIWTVDAQKTIEFCEKYKPHCDIILVQINWENTGGLYLISKQIQTDTMSTLGRDNYFNLPKQGTNPRGVEISKRALHTLLVHDKTQCIEISWEKEKIYYKPFDRWIDLWHTEQ